MLLIWTIRNIKIRYKQSLLGGAWAILQPLSLMIIYTLVFSLLAKVPSDEVPYPLFSYVGLVPWVFLATSITFGVPSLLDNLNLVTKTQFPREILPLGAIGSGFFDFLIASTISVILAIYYGTTFSWTIAWLPLIVAVQVMLTIGITLIGSAIIVRHRDVRFIVPLGLQIWLYASPIIYPISLVPEGIRPFYMLNPMAGIIQSYRRVILNGEPPILTALAISGLIAIVFLLVGYLLFKRLEVSFADII